MMATITTVPADLPLEELTIYHVLDPYLSSVILFYGPVATANATVSSSRIQVHIFTAAGFKSYPRITVSPAAPLYAAVNHLPRERQGDEVCRGLAVGILKYFTELSEPVKQSAIHIAKTIKPSARMPKIFDETHAADLANRMVKVESTADLVRDLRDAYAERKVPSIDIDVVLPAGTIQPLQQQTNHDQDDVFGMDDQILDQQYGKFASLVKAFGEPVFLPTSRIRRAPSQPSKLNKSKVFTKSQKEALRLAMCEVVDTEERYVGKIYDLVHNVAEDFRQKARLKPPSSTSPDEAALASLFPNCLNEILSVNMGFLEVIRQILEQTEQEALLDLGDDTDLQSSVSSRSPSKQNIDAMGSIAFANALLDWFPRFSEPYAEYMLAHTHFTLTLNTFLKDSQSSFSHRVYETGEQKLRSLLVEPIQRLPRYSLLIDAMTSNLPAIHPAVKPFLKARDVIKDICSLDNVASTTDHVQILKKITSKVEFWPGDLIPAGRLITAVDINEVIPPFRPENQQSLSNPGILLLFKNCLILLSRIPGSLINARALTADLEKPPTSVDNSSGIPTALELRFSRAFALDALRCTQSQCGSIIFLQPVNTVLENTRSTAVASQALQLLSSSDCRAGRLIEEINKAKIEGRFTEKERETASWTLRSPTGTFGNIGLLTAIFEEDPTGVMNRTGYSNIRVVFDTPKAVRTRALSNSPLEVIVSLSFLENGNYRMEIDAVAGPSTADIVTGDSVVLNLSKRIYDLLQPLSRPDNSTLSESLFLTNLGIIRQISSQLLAQTRTPRTFRPPSPSKLISSLWGSQSKDSPSLSKTVGLNPLGGDFPKMTPSRINLVKSTTAYTLEETASKVSVVSSSSAKRDESLRFTEQTFTAYIIALRSRSGNIVGRTLRTRANADESMVNELYNILLNDPTQLQAAAEAPVDVLFVAFENFIFNAWAEQIGPIITPVALAQMQDKFDTAFPRDFEIFFRRSLEDMSPQNRRALTAMVRLLGDLLEASGNDGDRGALTAAFAEILSQHKDPMHYVSLLDRLIDDFENLFDVTPSATTPTETPKSRPVSVNAGSISSATSSFRKRFGLGLHRENSKNEGESKVGSLIRSLSKNRNGGDADSKISLFRSRSTDSDSRVVPAMLGAVPRDRPALYGIFRSEENLAENENSQLASPLNTIDESPSRNPSAHIKKKRRSSLSDLQPLSTPSKSVGRPVVEALRPLASPPGKRDPHSEVPSANAQTKAPTSPGRPSSTRLPQTPRTPTHLPAPVRPVSPTRPLSPVRKENAQKSTLTERAVNKKTDGPFSTPAGTKKRSEAMSNLPQSLKLPSTKERPASGQSPDASPRRARAGSSPQKPQRLRMQSPQKLRERLVNEKKAQASADNALKADVAAVGNDLAAPRMPPSAPSSPSKSKTGPSSAGATGSAHIQRIRSLETKFTSLMEDMRKRTLALEKDVETTLLVSEKRAKKLDELYREASAENEALYERFNTEISNVVKAVRMGNGEECLKSQLKESLEESARLKKENMRLKRELSGLKAQQAGDP